MEQVTNKGSSRPHSITSVQEILVRRSHCSQEVEIRKSNNLEME